MTGHARPPDDVPGELSSVATQLRTALAERAGDVEATTVLHDRLVTSLQGRVHARGPWRPAVVTVGTVTVAALVVAGLGRLDGPPEPEVRDVVGTTGPGAADVVPGGPAGTTTEADLGLRPTARMPTHVVVSRGAELRVVAVEEGTGPVIEEISGAALDEVAVLPSSRSDRGTAVILTVDDGGGRELLVNDWRALGGGGTVLGGVGSGTSVAVGPGADTFALHDDGRVQVWRRVDADWRTVVDAPLVAAAGTTVDLEGLRLHDASEVDGASLWHASNAAGDALLVRFEDGDQQRFVAGEHPAVAPADGVVVDLDVTPVDGTSPVVARVGGRDAPRGLAVTVGGATLPVPDELAVGVGVGDEPPGVELVGRRLLLTHDSRAWVVDLDTAETTELAVVRAASWVPLDG